MKRKLPVIVLSVILVVVAIGAIAFVLNFDTATDDDTSDGGLTDQNAVIESEDTDEVTVVNDNDSTDVKADLNNPAPEESIRTGIDGLHRDADIIYINYAASGYPQSVMDSHAKALALELLDAVEYRSPEQPLKDGEMVFGSIEVYMIVETDEGPLHIGFLSSGPSWNTLVIYENSDSPVLYAAPSYCHDTLQELLSYLRPLSGFGLTGTGR